MFNLPAKEKEILQFWQEHKIFKKSVDKEASHGDFVFYEGPPTANGKPGIHHVEARAFKDLIPRYKTMAGFKVERKAGWDTHGLPVEIEVEKELGIKRKDEIEKFGIAAFNERAKASVWRYKDEWDKLTERIGFWLDLKNPYVTYDNDYIESLWKIFDRTFRRGFLKQSYRISPYCPRCQTTLSSHELGQPGVYKKTKDPSVFVKFKLKPAGAGKKAGRREYLLVWTTTPWTLPSNVAVAVNPAVTYTKYRVGEEFFWSHNPPPETDGRTAEVVEKISGQKLLGRKYEPLYPAKGRTGENFWRTLAADFVETTEGTGMVHIAPAFGEDDFNLIKNVFFSKNPPRPGDIPVTVDERGFMKKGFPGGGKFVKEADKDILDDLRKRGLLYEAGAVEHDYPFCWRCATPLLYFARLSWFIEISRLKDKLLAANETINWIPAHLKKGRFGEWLKEIKDWAISRDRYWGTPLPIWQCEKCARFESIGGLEDLNKRRWSKNRFFIMRHGEATANVEGWIAAGSERSGKISKLTPKGKKEIVASAAKLKKKNIGMILCSPYRRTTETAKILAKELKVKYVADERLREINCGIFNGRPTEEHKAFFAEPLEEFSKTPPGGENLTDVKKRIFSFLLDIDRQHAGAKILLVGHGDPLWMLEAATKHLSDEEAMKISYIATGEAREISLNNWPYNGDAKIDCHRPHLDEVFLRCARCRAKMKRVKDVADVWFDSGAMPFASLHYPFENKKMIDAAAKRAAPMFPADFICEAIDQTRGWFYTLLAVSVLTGRAAPYRNVISVGHVLDKNGEKMSKSKGNAVDPREMFQKYGADAVRWYFYTVNPPGEPKRFDERELAKTMRKFIFILYNSFVFFETYASDKANISSAAETGNVMDRWILARCHELFKATRERLNRYEIEEAGREIDGFIDDLSRWYIRRSRRRFQKPRQKREREEASAVLRFVLRELSKILAPFAPFFAEALYQSLNQSPSDPQRNGKRKNLSVHLEDWPKADAKIIDAKLLAAMSEIRRIASLALAKRAEAGIKVRQPLATLKLKNSQHLENRSDLLDVLKDEVNVKEIVFDGNIKEEMELDTVITAKLREEGLLREFIRIIQELRQKAACSPKDAVALMIEAPAETERVLKNFQKTLSAETSAKSAEFKKTEKFDAEIYSELDGRPFWVGIRKIKS